jgi:SAM-dependent methyltransferase
VRAVEWDDKWRGRLDEHRHAELTGQPSRFLVSAVEGSEPGRALDLACGAGRHAVWLAERGWQVTAVDFSEVALAEARRLAAVRGVDVEWIAADVLAWEPPARAFELVLLLYLQVPGHELRQVLAHAAGALAADGRLVVVGHHSDNLEHGHGGPSSAAVLYTEADVEARLPGLRVERAERVVRPVETADGSREAIDALVVATAPA